MIQVDFSKSSISEQEIEAYQEKCDCIHQDIVNKTGRGNDYLGWVDWPIRYDKEEAQRIKDLAKKMEGRYDTVIVCGIGGSYLGARAAVEMIRGLYPEQGPEIYFTGNTLSSTTLAQLLKKIETKEVVLNVISKSGTTTETSIAFRLFKQALEKKYGKQEAAQRIFATTDKHRGSLKELADKEGYAEFVVPDDIGGRYSVFTAVGLLPMALCGVDIDAVMKGSLDAYNDYATSDLKKNPAYRYAVARRIMDDKGLSAEMFVSYEPQYAMISEWLKQLFGESEGKEGKGILPTSTCFTTDLHSLGQFIQEGKKTFFETILHFDACMEDIEFPYDEDNDDRMNYLSGKMVSWVNEQAFKGTLEAHADTASVNNIVVSIPDNSAYSFGYLIYFFFRACAMSCYLLDINPFNQPGVEVYKKNMFRLLGKE